ncbi:MAG TPA: cytidylate kinase [Methanomicrobia archaeon]|nr:cytidylate kinase [Methanomicrobia archaeon]
MRITIGGPPGSGTTTVAQKVAAEFGLTHIYAGKIFRDMAAERGISLGDFGSLAERDDKFDREVDKRLHDMAVEDTITEGRMAAFVVSSPDLTIWIDAPLDVRVSRIAKREPYTEQQIREMTLEREESEKQRYSAYYGVNIYALSHYDIVINSGKWDSDGVFAIVKSAITSLARATQE